MLYNYTIDDIHSSKEQVQKCKQDWQNSLEAAMQFYEPSVASAEEFKAHLQKWDGKKVTARLASSFNTANSRTFTEEALYVEFTSAKDSWKGYPYIAIACRSFDYYIFEVETDDDNCLDADATISNMMAEIEKMANQIEARKKVLANFDFLHQQYMQALQTVAVIEQQIRECDTWRGDFPDMLGITLAKK